MREAVVHGSDIGKAAPRAANGRLRPGGAPEEKKPHVSFFRLPQYLFVRVQPVKNLPLRCLIFEIADDLDGLFRIKRAISGQAKLIQPVTREVHRVSGKNQPSETIEDRIGHDIGKLCVPCDLHSPSRFSCRTGIYHLTCAGTEQKGSQSQMPQHALSFLSRLMQLCPLRKPFCYD
jgi:hypothetical protein